MSRGEGWSSGDRLDIYKVAVEEYRFQASLNWRRTQYLFALNGAILAVGAGLIEANGEQQTWLIGVIFLLGFLTSLHAIVVTRKQHQYYRNARDHMKTIARSVGLPDEYLLVTTPGMTHRRPDNLWARVSRVTVMHYGLFGFLAVFHALGVVYVFLAW